jgi:hypothetical protein
MKKTIAKQSFASVAERVADALAAGVGGIHLEELLESIGLSRRRGAVGATGLVGIGFTCGVLAGLAFAPAAGPETREHVRRALSETLRDAMDGARNTTAQPTAKRRTRPKRASRGNRREPELEQRRTGTRVAAKRTEAPHATQASTQADT